MPLLAHERVMGVFCDTYPSSVESGLKSITNKFWHADMHCSRNHNNNTMWLPPLAQEIEHVTEMDNNLKLREKGRHFANDIF